MKTFTVVGYQGCANFQHVSDMLASLVNKYPQHLRGEIVGGFFFTTIDFHSDFKVVSKVQFF